MGNYYESWVTSVRATLAEMASMDFGYPLGTNEVREKSPEPHVVPPALEPLYATFDGVSLMDIWVGYRIHPADRVESADEWGAPVSMSVEGNPPRPIQVFGSDGGGNMFALGLDDGAVYYLPHEAGSTDGVYIEDEVMPVVRLGRSVIEFLERLKIDIEAFVHGEEGHIYMDSWRQKRPDTALDSWRQRRPDTTS